MKKIEKTIEQIHHSGSSNRKALFQEFLTYANRVDGETTDIYSGFAYNYPLENTRHFFEVLVPKDTILLKKWAKIASLEYQLLLDNMESSKEFEKKLRNDFEGKLEKLNPYQKHLAECYFNKLLGISNESGNINQKQEEIIVKNTFLSDFLYGSNLNDVNQIDEYAGYDFTNIWMSRYSNSVIGTIGDDNQRIRIIFLEISKNPENPLQYLVKGKSKVRNNICDFAGTITLEKIWDNEPFYYDNKDKISEKRIVKAGLLIANYEFSENKQQKASGKFTGKLYSKWVLDIKDNMDYDDRDAISDAFTNNIFIGTWTSYKTGRIKNCSWSDYRAPEGTPDLDIGAAEFSPNKKYFDKGWKNYYEDKDVKWWK